MAGFIIREVALRDFISHRQTRLELGRGVIAFVGRNGAGKSSIVDAIYLSLVPHQREIPRGRPQDLVNRASPTGEAQVQVALEAPGERVDVETRISQKGRSVVVRRNRAIAARGVNPALETLASILGMPRDNYREVMSRVVIVRQGGLEEILNKLTAQGKKSYELLQDIFGVSLYREARERLRELQLGDDETGLYTPTSYSLRRLQEAIHKAEEAIAQNMKRAEEKRTLLEQLRKRLEEAEQRLKEAQGRRRELEEALQKYQALKGELSVLQDQERSLQAEIALLEREIRVLSCGSLTEEEERLRTLLDRVGDAPARLERENARISGLEAEAERLRDARELLEEYNRKAQHYNGEEHEAVKREAERVEEELRVARETRARLESASRSLGSASRGARAALVRAGVEAPDAPTRLLEALRRALEEVGQKRSKLEEKARVLRERAAMLEAEASRSRRIAELLSGRERKCPVCGSPLTEEGASRLRREHEEKAYELEREALQLREEAGRLEAEARRLERVEVALQKALASLEGAVRQVRELGVNPDSVSEELESLQARIRRAEERLTRLRGELERLDRLQRELDLLRERLEKRGITPSREALEQVSAELSAVEEELRKAREAREGVEKALLEATGAANIEEALKILERAAKRLEEIARSLVRCRELEARLEGERKRLSEVRERVKEAMESLRRLEPAVEEARRLDSIIEGLQKEARRLEAELRGVESELRLLEEQARREEERLGKLAELRRKLEILAYLREHVFPRAEAMLFQEKLRRLQEEASRILASFQLDYTSVIISVDPSRESVSFSLLSRSGETVSVNMLSGGERTAFALAMVLALNRILAGRTGFLILDEPTANLDEERRRMLVDVIRRLGSEGVLDQLIIVTHDPEVEDAADIVCRVERPPTGWSVVECPHG